MRHPLVIFAAFYPPFTGGYAKSVQALASRIVRRGWRVTVVTTATHGGSAQAIEQGVAVIRLPAWNTLGTYPIPRPSRLLWRTLRQLLGQPISVISTQTRFFPTSGLGLFVGLTRRIPIVHTERGSVHAAFDHPLVRLINWFVDHTLGSLLVRRADRVIGVSRSAAAFCRHLGARAPETIPNGIELARFTRQATPAAPDRPPTIIFTGRLIWAKGVQDLIAAVAARLRQGRPTRLLIVGEGVYRSALEEHVLSLGCGSAIDFLGSQPASAIPGLLAQADVFVNPSYSEGLPTAVLEAAASGLPVVATKVGGTAEIVEDGVSGYLIEPRDRPALTQALERLLDDPGRAGAMGARGRLIAARFDWEAVTQAYLKVFTAVLRRTGNGD